MNSFRFVWHPNETFVALFLNCYRNFAISALPLQWA